MADFKQACKWMKEGKKVRRKLWNGENENYFLDNKNDVISSTNCYEPFRIDDFEADDWEKVEIKEPTESLSDKIQSHLKTTNCIGIEQTHNFIYIDDVKYVVRKILNLNEFGIKNKIRAINGKETNGEWFVSVEDFKNKIKELVGDKLL
ncbi:MAG: hypothetical protein ACFFG0_02970 [Candidatus Thorarchaeota archaeon]